MTADVDRAVLVWPLVASLVVTFGTTGFVLLSARERVCDLQAVAASLVTPWRLLAAVIFLVSPLVLLNVTDGPSAVLWVSAMTALGDSRSDSWWQSSSSGCQFSPEL